MSALALSRVHFPVTALGPGRRVGIWFQGCTIRCPGCVSADTWAPRAPATEVGALLAAIAPWLAEADGVTITGGEPFDQPDALVALVLALAERFDGDLLLYSGYPLESLGAPLARLAGRVDALIGDPYRADAPDRLPLRGSDNQRLHLLSARARARYAGYLAPGGKARALDLVADGRGGFWLAGIPRRGDLAALEALLRGQGHRLATSEQRRKGTA